MTRRFLFLILALTFFSLPARAEFTELPPAVRQQLLEPYLRQQRETIRDLLTRTGLQNPDAAISLQDAIARHEALLAELRKMETELGAETPPADADKKELARIARKANEDAERARKKVEAAQGYLNTAQADMEGLTLPPEQSPDGVLLAQMAERRLDDGNANIDDLRSKLSTQRGAAKLIRLKYRQEQLKSLQAAVPPLVEAAKKAKVRSEVADKRAEAAASEKDLTKQKQKIALPPGDSPGAAALEDYRRQLPALQQLAQKEEKRLLAALNATAPATEADFDRDAAELSSLCERRRRLTVDDGNRGEAERLDRQITEMHERLVLQIARAKPHALDHLRVLGEHLHRHSAEAGAGVLILAALAGISSFSELRQEVVQHALWGLTSLPLIMKERFETFLQTRNWRDLIPFREHFLAHWDEYQKRLDARRASGNLRTTQQLQGRLDTAMNGHQQSIAQARDAICKINMRGLASNSR